MAITQTGSVLVLDSDSTPAVSNAASGTIAITVPGDCTLVVIGVSGYSSTANLLSTNGSFDIGGNASVGVGGAASTSFWQSAEHYILNPATGAQNLDWQWGGGAGTAVTAASLKVTVSFWKGVDTGSPTRDSDGAQAGGATATTPTLTALSGDLIIATGATQDNEQGELTFAWSGASEVSGGVHQGEADISLATASPSGNQTVGFTATGADESSVSAWVFKAAGGATITPDMWLPRAEPLHRPKAQMVASGMTPPNQVNLAA